MEKVISVLSSDMLLPALVAIPCIFFGIKLLYYADCSNTSFISPKLRDNILHILGFEKLPPFSLQRAVHAYEHYYKLSEWDIRGMKKSYGRMNRAHKRIGYEIGYPGKLLELERVTKANSEVTSAIAALARRGYKVDSDSPFAHVDGGDLTRVREALKHFVRDWSEEGRAERNAIFEPCLSYLRQIDEINRHQKKVIVPGCGLGRIAWDISLLGFDTTANELSGSMILALKFILDVETTRNPFQHEVYPYAHWFSHQRQTSSLFRSIRFPDSIPRLSPTFHLLEADFLRIPHRSAFNYDIIVTVFFVDTSLNIIETLEQIFRLLSPGGIWLNIGPLLWTGGSQASLELSLDEMLRLVETVGFRLEENSRKSVECEYTADTEAMMRWIYKAEFWAARKPS